MIRFLRIRNLATIEDLELRPEAGFSVLTGETGAGKSIIIDSLRLICGEKASAGLIRTGRSEAIVEALLSFPETAALPEGLLPEEGNEIPIQRVISEQGPGKAYCGGILVPLKKLREVAAPLIDIYGQNDHVFLLRLESHREYLDRFAGALALHSAVAASARELRETVRRRDDWRSRERERRQRLDYLDYQIREVEKAGLRPGEEEELRAQRHLQRHAEKARSLAEQALELADSGEMSLATLSGRLQGTLRELAAFDSSFAELAESLSPMVITAREVASALTRFQDRHDDSPDRLDAIENRLSQIEGLKRKYGGGVDDILALWQSAQAERNDLGGIEGRLADADTEVARLFAEYQEVASRLTARRREAAAELEALIEKELSLLGMKKTRFSVRLEPRPLLPETAGEARDAGQDEIEFLISPNPGEDLKPLRRIASGGELSRIMLALKASGKEADESATMIFDEIDAGIGGKTADSVAQKLRRLSRGRQILCITHLPQIASFADHHFRVDKHIEKERTYTTVRKLDGAERVEELARLMTGSRVTDLARENAREMLRHNLKE